jgi:hypothetical protein
LSSFAAVGVLCLLFESVLTDSTGYTGTAEPVGPLEENIGLESPVGLTGEEHMAIPHENTVTPSSLADEGLTWTTKLFFLALIVAACYGYVKMHTARRTGPPAGRHGAYVKGAV